MVNISKNLFIIALITFILIIIYIIVNASFKNNYNEAIFNISTENYVDSYGLSIEEKNIALTLVLKNKTTENLVETLKNNTHLSQKLIGNITAINASIQNIQVLDSGYLNTTDVIAKVPVFFGDSAPYIEYFTFYADISKNIIIGYESYGDKIIPLDSENIILSNTYWYHQLTGIYSVIPKDYTSIHFRLKYNYTDSNDLYPMILDKINFNKFKNGSDYEPLKYVDTITGLNTSFNGDNPIQPQVSYNDTTFWYANISISHKLSINDQYFQPNFYYVVIKNNNSTKDISIQFSLTLLSI
jgi:hypothetical protein